MNNIEILEDYLDKQDRKFVSEYRLMFLEAIENLIQENKELKEKLEEKDMQHELELIGKEEYNKRVATIIKYEQEIKTFLDDTNITDIEPWSEYKIKGQLLFDLEKVLEE